MNRSILAFGAALLLGAGTLHAQITFDSSFESGNGTGFTLVGGVYEFQMEPDTLSTDNQWFYFAVSGAEGQTLTFRLTGTNQSNVPSHWNTAWPIASADGGETWVRVDGPVSHSSPNFTFTHEIQSDNERIAFHYPYTVTRADEKIVEWAAHPHVDYSVIGESIQGRPIDLLQITDPAVDDSSKIGIWVIARLHSAETTASYSVERFIDYALSSEEDALALRAGAIINVVPMANPDGVVLGNYRNNAAGINLNRVWDGSANASTSPEVLAIQGEIDQWVAEGNSYVHFLDFHSTSGANPHFAFHAAASVQPANYPTPATYHADSRAYLALVNDFAPHFHPTQGASTSTSQLLAYHRQRIQHGVLAFTPEGAYNYQNYGPNAGDFMTIDQHLLTGEAMARALVAYYELEAPTSVDSWMIY